MTIHEIKLNEKVYYLSSFGYMPQIHQIVVHSFEYTVTENGTEITKINGSDADRWDAKEFYATKEDARHAALKIIKENYEYQLDFLQKQ